MLEPLSDADNHNARLKQRQLIARSTRDAFPSGLSDLVDRVAVFGWHRRSRRLEPLLPDEFAKVLRSQPYADAVRRVLDVVAWEMGLTA